ncbi:hypothetical protein [Novacetimonas pomaceti]|uniref:hypothetical protein n=1 Tax=Novacetimonas pomaceti TaxID=2021998 RepID=UPI001C2CF8C0|nr:hypothetical protein [Novacetimonas pomaceti]MBV1833901.1 hypothetical protein [Novacetimonas pomaceti]
MDTPRLIEAYADLIRQVDASSAATIALGERLRERTRHNDPTAREGLRQVQSVARSYQEERLRLAALWRAISTAHPELPRYPMDDADGVVMDAAPRPREEGRLVTLLRRLLADIGVP